MTSKSVVPMDYPNINEQASMWFELAGRRLKRGIERSVQARITVLGLLNVAGSAMMLTPLISLLAAASTALHMRHRLQGPLDLFLMEVLVVICLASGILSYQLLTIRPAAPPGVRLDETRQERFFSMLERRVRHFRKPRIDGARLTTAAEITVTATPRGFIPLFHVHTLCVGVPLLFFVSGSRFRLALAGAIAAAAQTRGGLRGRAVQASLDWAYIVDAFEQHPSLAARLFLPPLRWLRNTTGALSRDLRGDRQSQQNRWILDKAGEDSVVELIAALVVAESFLANLYWPMIFKAAERCPTPVVHPFSHFELLLRKTLTMEAARRWMLQAQAGRGTSGRGVREQLSDLNLDQLHWNGIPEHTAFADVFGDSSLLKDLDTLWRETAAPAWNQRHTRFQKQKRRFEQLQEKSRQQVLRGESAINFVKLASRFLEAEQAASVYRKMHTDNSDNATLCFVCGQQMLAAGLAREALDVLQHAAELDNSLANQVQAITSAHRHSWSTTKPVYDGIAEIA